MHFSIISVGNDLKKIIFVQGSIQQRGPTAAKKRPAELDCFQKLKRPAELDCSQKLKRPAEVDWFQKLKRARTKFMTVQDDGETATDTQQTVR